MIQNIEFSNEEKSLWESWVEDTNYSCHITLKISDNDYIAHTQKSLDNAILRIQESINRVNFPLNGINILDIGASVGFKSIALSELYPDSKVFGLEPNSLAVKLGNVIVKKLSRPNVQLREGFGEDLPFEDNSIDVIFSETVIEHVQDVEKCISEMARVLKPGGKIILDAPNYIWPYEPHLEIFCFPLLGKPFMRLCAFFQGKKGQIYFLEHLKLVNKFSLETHFKRNGLNYYNLTIDKFDKVINGKAINIKQYKLISKLLKNLGNNFISKFLISICLKLGFYPSISYLVTKNS